MSVLIFDLSKSLKAKCDDAGRLGMYDFLLVLNRILPNTAPFQETSLQNLSDLHLPFMIKSNGACRLPILLLTTLTSGPNFCMIVAENAAPANNRR